MKFGPSLRAAIWGYHAIAGLGLCRIAAVGPPYRVDVVPFQGFKPGEWVRFVSWWEGDAVEVERTIRRHVPAVYKPVTIWLNDDGDRVERMEATNGQPGKPGQVGNHDSRAADRTH